jgi:hypothetical protein|tara:strand:- start:830 stop:1048 length:219 start_codon:yes stop_codon:yes gene_type:complete
MYDVPELNHPKRSALIKLYSKLNSSVNPLIPKRKTPTQKPEHIWHLNSFPSFPSVGRIESKILPYTTICVSP